MVLCKGTWPVLLWACVPIFIHGLAAIGYKLTLEKRQTRMSTVPNVPIGYYSQQGAVNQDWKTPTQRANDMSNYDQAQNNDGRGGIIGWLQSEVMSCASHLQKIQLRLPRETMSTKVHIGIGLTCISGFLSFFHLLYGTVTFSGLLFIHTLDAIGLVLMRLLASAIVCRFIVLVEIAGMRGAVWNSASKS